MPAEWGSLSPHNTPYLWSHGEDLDQRRTFSRGFALHVRPQDLLSGLTALPHGRLPGTRARCTSLSPAQAANTVPGQLGLKSSELPAQVQCLRPLVMVEGSPRCCHGSEGSPKGVAWGQEAVDTVFRGVSCTPSVLCP